MGRLAYVSINKPKHKQAPFWMFLLHYHSKGIYQQKCFAAVSPAMGNTILCQSIERFSIEQYLVSFSQRNCRLPFFDIVVRLKIFAFCNVPTAFKND